MSTNSYIWKDDEKEKSFNYLYKSLSKIFNSKENKELVHADVGCGNGYLTSKISQFFKITYGFDTSKLGIEIAKKSFGDKVKFEIIEEDLKKIESDYYDIITAIEVIEHVYDPRKFLQKLKVKLKKNGKLVISTPYHGFFKNLAIILSNNFDHHFNPLWLHGHIKFFSKKTLETVLKENKFKIDQIHYSGRFYPLSKSMIFVVINE